MWSCYIVLFLYSRYAIAVTPAIDNGYIESFVNEKVCENHLDILANTYLGRIFRQSSAYITPDTIRLEEKVSLGSYTQCLSINERIANDHIEGKYCLLKVDIPRAYVRDELLVDDIKWPDNATIAKIRGQREEMDSICAVPSFPWRDFRYHIQVDIGACIPKSCSSRQASKWILNNFGTSSLWSEVFNPGVQSDSLNYRPTSCRLPHDKPISVADYIAVTCLTFLFLLVLSSTLYDLKCRDKMNPRPLYQSFSIYSNGIQLTKTKSQRGSIECVDGIRALSMFWIMLLHSYYHRLNAFVKKSDVELALVSSGLFAVDTFFLLSGIFVVYSSIGRFSTKTFINQLPIFYLNRLIRLLPILLMVMLLQASLLNHISDGPNWHHMANNVDSCRNNWLISLLFIDNIVQVCQNSVLTRCLTHAWYIDLDTQMYFISPMVIYWLLKSKKTAITALITAISIFIATTAIFSVTFKFSFNDLYNISHRYNADYYMKFMYMNPLTRGTPFFIGMLFGYILHLNKGKNIKLKLITKVVGWSLACLVIFPSLYLMDIVLQPNFVNDVINSILNTLWRNMWSVAVGWIVFACHHGFGGIVNWLLSLNLWKLPSKMSYAMYLVHYPLVRILNADVGEARTFTTGSEFYTFLAVSAMTLMISFLLTVTIEIPMANLYKIITGNFKPELESHRNDGNNNNRLSGNK